MKRLILTGLALLLLAGFGATPSGAQAPEKWREFVYGAQLFDGRRYDSTFYPLTTETIYLLADVTHILSPRESLVYFWAITNEQKADWDGLNEVVAGTLEILQGGQVIHTLEQTKYVIQYPTGLDSGEVYLYLGDEAEAQYQEFDRQRRAFRDEVAAYYEATVAYREALADIAQQENYQGDIPQPPPEPEPFLFFSTGVFEGAPVNLPAGKYAIRVRGPDGQITPPSERKLVVFEAEREGVSYKIIPYDKWTTPEQSDDPGQTFYVRSDAILYLQPIAAKEYNQLYFNRLKQPQSTSGSLDRWTWFPLTPIEAGTLEILDGGQVARRIERRPYVVRQYTGSALGYEIIDQLAASEERFKERSPDFEAYELNFADLQRSSFTIRLVDTNGAVIPGSERQIKLINTTASRAYFLLPVLPLLVGAGVIFWRRSKLASLPKFREQ
jgi:hypothetical protein